MMMMNEKKSVDLTPQDLALLGEGIYAAPRLMMCTSTPMTTETIETVLGGFRRAVKEIRPALV